MKKQRTLIFLLKLAKFTAINIQKDNAKKILIEYKKSIIWIGTISIGFNPIKYRTTKIKIENKYIEIAIKKFFNSIRK